MYFCKKYFMKKIMSILFLYLLSVLSACVIPKEQCPGVGQIDRTNKNI